MKKVKNIAYFGGENEKVPRFGRLLSLKTSKSHFFFVGRNVFRHERVNGFCAHTRQKADLRIDHGIVQYQVIFYGFVIFFGVNESLETI